jgi:hypothetical protein
LGDRINMVSPFRRLLIFGRSGLSECGVRLKSSRVQTDNVREFVGNWQAKSESAFTLAVEAVQCLRLEVIYQYCVV